jgi:hypothetical protein
MSKIVSEKILKNYCSSGPKRPSAAQPNVVNRARGALTRAPGRNLGLGRESRAPPGPKAARTPAERPRPSDRNRRSRVDPGGSKPPREPISRNPSSFSLHSPVFPPTSSSRRRPRRWRRRGPPRRRAHSPVRERAAVKWARGG